MSDDGRTIRFDTRLESYEPFFDPQWADEQLERAHGTALNLPLLDLLGNWKAASHSHSVPIAFSKCLQACFTYRFTEGEPEFLAIVDAVRQKTVAKLHAKGFSPSECFDSTLQAALNEIGDEAKRAYAIARESAIPSLQSVWEMLIAETYLRMFIWRSQRDCYCALYQGYECFLKECVRIAKGVTSYRIGRTKEFGLDLNATLGPTVLRDCWTCRDVVIARYARHAFAHNGARLTNDLAGQEHNFLVDDGQVQVMPEHVHRLFELLKNKVGQLVAAAVSLEQFR